MQNGRPELVVAEHALRAGGIRAIYAAGLGSRRSHANRAAAWLTPTERPALAVGRRVRGPERGDRRVTQALLNRVSGSRALSPEPDHNT
jgi:hypothetical protein